MARTELIFSQLPRMRWSLEPRFLFCTTSVIARDWSKGFSLLKHGFQWKKALHGEVVAIFFLSLGEHMMNRAAGWFHRFSVHVLHVIILFCSSIAAVTLSYLFLLRFSSKLLSSQLIISVFLSFSPKGVCRKGAAAWGLISSWL